MKYKINEIFKSFQGEGTNLGKEVIFIRFSGCNLNCEWCDTEHSKYNEMNEHDILKEVEKLNCKSIILTGGEPTIYNLFPLLFLLKKYWIGIESNGANIKAFYGKIDYIAVSPKRKMFDLKVDEIRLVNDNLNIDDMLYYEKFDIKNKFISVLEQNGYFNLKETFELLGKVNEKVKNKWRINEQYHKRLKIK